MLSARDITELRDTAELAMPSVMQLWRATEVDYPGGGASKTWSKIGTDVPCALSNSLSSTALVGDQARTEADAVVLFRGDAVFDVQPRDRIRVDGIDYEVQGYAEREDRWQVTKRVLVSRV